jgi:Plasmid pRiA4b ORF-3-like protein
VRQQETIVKPPTLTEAQKSLLQSQVIDDLHPGALLHDFQVVLDRVGTVGVKAAGKYNLLPIELIPELDAKLHRPLQLSLTMKRPQLRSHPYLQGLHLLLRATGLTRVEGTGARARLVVDPAVHASWNGLNPTERYFALLEAWLIFGRAEMVGERGSSWSDFLMQCLQLWQYLPVSGKAFDLDRPQDAYLYPIRRDFYHLSLFDLFGLLAVKVPPKPVQPWCPAAVQHVPFGDAVLTILQGQFERSRGFWGTAEDEPEAEESFGFGSWQPLFLTYFPAWKNNLVLPEEEVREGVFIFRVSLRNVWRRIAIAAESTLDELVGCILDAFDFDFDHLYQFTYRDGFGATVTVSDPRGDEGPFTDEELIGELPLTVGQAMDLLYDFGDSWHFTVKLESIEPARARQKLPKVLEKHGKAPEQYPYSDF